MQKEPFKPSTVTLVNVLKACSALEFLDNGRVIHALVVEEGFEFGTIIGSALTNMYAKCGELTDASCVLERQPNRHIGIWNALITGYTQHGSGEKALKLFQKMSNNGFMPNEVTFVCILKACASTKAIEKGKQIHDKKDLSIAPWITLHDGKVWSIDMSYSWWKKCSTIISTIFWCASLPLKERLFLCHC